MIEHRPFASLHAEEHGWLQARHHIFWNRRTGPDSWGALCAWNDDEIAPNSGFPSHAHANMEIITYVRDGLITHRDNLGNTGHIHAGDVQVMSAGTGIRHAEYNLERTPARLFQIWIVPDRAGGAPAWGTKSFPKNDRAGQFVPLASGFEQDVDALPIRSRARVLGATLRAAEKLDYAFEAGRMGYLVATGGSLEINGTRLDARDGAAIKEVELLDVQALQDVELVLVDVPA
jgi:redox-sensitive bicupin YhaK (pirin superfamily)